jgi:hypothetical protein
MMNTKEQYETLASVIEDKIIRHGELISSEGDEGIDFYGGVPGQGVTDYGSGRMAGEKPKSLIKINLYVSSTSLFGSPLNLGDD